MPEIHVARRFTLNHHVEENGERVPVAREFLPGKYEVSDEIANHWFVKPQLVVNDTVRDEQVATEAALLREAHGVSASVVTDADTEQLRAELAAAVDRAEAAEHDREEAGNQREMAAKADAQREQDAVDALAAMQQRAERAEALVDEKQRAIEKMDAELAALRDDHSAAVKRAATAEQALDDATAPTSASTKGSGK